MQISASRRSAAATMMNPGTRPRRGGRRGGRSHQQSRREMRKPQLDFYDYPFDNSNAPFVAPYSAAAPASESSDAASDLSYVEAWEKDEASAKNKKKRVHPLEAEIERAEIDNLSSIASFDPEDVTLFLGPDKAPFTFVRKKKELFAMAKRLETKRAIAVDIENHQTRSFLGFTCLMQISTREEDFVIDTLALRAFIHRALAPVFADASVVKVLHGADNDVEWLERDFGIYVVNLFDTGQAARVLKYPSFSLSHLLSHHCGVTVTKKLKKNFQCADWRQRPLPPAMLAYARSDTHYLLYIFDRVRAELAKKDALAEAYSLSAKVARRRFRKPPFKPGAMRMLVARQGLGLDAHQIRAMKAIHRWRDATARELDESWHYVLSNADLLAITLAMDAARTPAGIEWVCLIKRVNAPVVLAQKEAVAKIIAGVLDSGMAVSEAVLASAAAPEGAKAQFRGQGIAPAAAPAGKHCETKRKESRRRQERFM